MLEKMQNIDRRIIWGVLLLGVSIPLFVPLGLPISISPHTRAFYEFIDALPPNSVLWFGTEYSAGSSGEINPQMAAVFRHAMSKDLQVILFGMWQDGPAMARDVVDPIAEEMGKTYGVDYVNLGYKPGTTSVLRTMVTDVWAGSANVDINGDSLSKFPLMDRVRTIGPDTIDAVIVYSSGSPGDGDYLTYWTDKYGMNLLTCQVAVQVTSRMPLLQSGQHKGMVPGLAGAAEYETLINTPSVATQLMDSQSAAHLAIILFVILGNVAFFGSQVRKGGK